MTVTQDQIVTDLIAVRRMPKVSRKVLATLTGLTESVIWRIETKGNIHPNERAALRPVLDDFLGRNILGPTDAATGGSPPGGSVDGATHDPVPGNAPARRGVADAPARQAAVGSVDTQPETPPAAAVTVDWGQLGVAAAGVSEHDLERGILAGPDRAAGFRLFSNSELQTFKTCRRKWWLGWYRQLRLRFESPVGALAIGDRIHRALRQWYVPKGLPRTDPRTALERLIVEDWTKVSNALASEPERLTTLQKKFNDEATLERAMIEGYMQWVAETGVDSELEVISSEMYLEADVTDLVPFELKTKLIGKLDVRARRQSDGVRRFIDHKTLADFNAVRQMVPMDEQMLTYQLLEFLTAGDGEERCDGALYNMLRKVKRTASAKPPFYDRVEVHHNRHELESFQRRVFATMADIIEVETRLNEGEHHLDVAYPRPTRDCRWSCDFFAVCPMFDDGSRAEAMLKQYYVVGDPLAYYRTEVSEGDTIE